jgi:hypothetical protein
MLVPAIWRWATQPRLLRGLRAKEDRDDRGEEDSALHQTFALLYVAIEKMQRGRKESKANPLPPVTDLPADDEIERRIRATY